MAALVIWSQAESFPRYRESTMLAHFPETLRAGWFEKSTDVCPVVRNGSRSPQWCGAPWRRQDTVHENFVKSTDVAISAVPPCCPIEITCNQVNFLRNSNGTKSLDEFFFSWTMNIEHGAQVNPPTHHKCYSQGFWARPFSSPEVRFPSQLPSAWRYSPPRPLSAACIHHSAGNLNGTRFHAVGTERQTCLCRGTWSVCPQCWWRR